MTSLVVSGHLYPANPLSRAARAKVAGSVVTPHPIGSSLPLYHRLLIFSSENGFPEEKLQFPALLQLEVSCG